MKVMLLEIDAHLKEIILAKLSDAGMLAINIHKKRDTADLDLDSGGFFMEESGGKLNTKR